MTSFLFRKNRQEISTHESSSFPPLKRSYLSPRIDLKIASILFPAILSFTLRCCTRRHPQQLPMMFYNEIDTKKIDPENIWYYSIVLRSVLSLNLVVFLYIYLCYIERLPLIDQWNSKYLNWKIKRRINKISKREWVRRNEVCFSVTKIHFVGVDV